VPSKRIDPRRQLIDGGRQAALRRSQWAKARAMQHWIEAGSRIGDDLLAKPH
jgi:hypothetical protein